MHRYSMLFDSVREKKKINMIKKKRTKNDRKKSEMPNMCFFLLLFFIKKKKKVELDILLLFKLGSAFQNDQILY